MLGWGRNQRRNRDCEGRRRLGISRQVDAVTIPQQLSTIALRGSRTKLLPYTNFYVEVLPQYRIKLLHVEVLTNVRIKLLHIEVLTIFPDKTSTLTKLIKNH